MKLHAPILIADTSTLLNLYASDKFEEILRVLSTPVTIVDIVMNETQYILRNGIKEQVDLSPYIIKGLLNITSFESGAERAQFIQFTQDLDDGEAATGAIAFHRKWDIAIDDKKGRTIFAREIPSSVCVGTLDIIAHVADCMQWDDAMITTIIKTIRSQARFCPQKGSLLETWWNSYLMR